MMANTDRNCSVLKLANTFGSEMSVERNSSMGMVMWTVAEILDRLSSTSGKSVLFTTPSQQISSASMPCPSCF